MRAIITFISMSLLLFTSCAGSPAWHSMQMSSTRSAAEKNNRKMLSLKVGMSKEEVLSIMGCPTKTESYDLGKGTIVEFYFYRTQGWSTHDLQDTDAQFTPLAFQNERLVGWGRNYYDKVIRQQVDVKVSDAQFGEIPAFDTAAE